MSAEYQHQIQVLEKNREENVRRRDSLEFIKSQVGEEEKAKLQGELQECRDTISRIDGIIQIYRKAIVELLPKLPDLQEHLISLEEQRTAILLECVQIRNSDASKNVKDVEIHERERTVALIDIAIEKVRKDINVILHLK